VRRVCVLIILALLVVTAGCVLQQPKAAALSGLELDYQNAAALVREKKYDEALAAYREIAAASPLSTVAGDALYEAAYLQVFYDNPQRDYSQALSGFDEFLKRFPEHSRANDACNWRFVLRTILDIKKENEHLKKNIEQLKKLDIRHEERRTK
jgi:outer membrane protein assembly factor BamD (BamD/ComL family)